MAVSHREGPGRQLRGAARVAGSAGEAQEAQEAGSEGVIRPECFDPAGRGTLGAEALRLQGLGAWEGRKECALVF